MERVIAIIAAVMVMAGGYGPATVSAADAPHAPGTSFEHVHALAFDSGGSSLWLGAHTGLFRSDDSRQTWTKVSLPVKHDAVDVMAVTPDPRDTGTVYIATHEA